MHLPSAPQLWQMPATLPLPIPLFVFFRLLPLELQEASYFAESARIFNLSKISILSPPNVCTYYTTKKQNVKHLFVKNIACNKMSNIAMKSRTKSIEKSRKIWFNRKEQLFLKLQKDLRVKTNFISKILLLKLKILKNPNQLENKNRREGSFTKEKKK